MGINTGATGKDAKGNIRGVLKYIVDVPAEKAVETLISNAVGEVGSLVAASRGQLDAASLQVDKMSAPFDDNVQKLDGTTIKVKTIVDSLKKAETGKIA